jgi:hypothetical protein
MELLGRLIWLSKKRKERNNKGKSKGTVQNHKKKQEKESERRQSEIGMPPYLVRPSFLIQHR